MHFIYNNKFDIGSDVGINAETNFRLSLPKLWTNSLKVKLIQNSIYFKIIKYKKYDIKHFFFDKTTLNN